MKTVLILMVVSCVLAQVVIQLTNLEFVLMLMSAIQERDDYFERCLNYLNKLTDRAETEKTR